MKITKGPFRYSSRRLLLRRSFQLCAVIAFLIAGVRCDDQGDNDSQPVQASLGASAPNEGIESQSFSSALGNLYIENFHDPSRNQLAKLLCEESYKTLLFQFYKLKNGRLTLVAFAGKQNNKDFNPYFHVLNWVDDAVVQDIEDKEVFLGDQKLTTDGDFRMLKDAINKGSKNDSSKNYVIFTPELKRFSADGKYVIEYSIRFTSSLEGFASQILPAGSGRLHPSPPY